MEMRFAFTILFCLLVSGVLHAQEPKVLHSVYMIGDAGSGEKAALHALQDKLKKEGKKSSVVFLGNNISPDGMPKKKRKRKRKAAEKIIDEQIEAAHKYKGHTYFIPGNEEWNNGKQHGRAAVRRLEDYVQSHHKKTKKIKFFPNKACGDPEIVEVNDGLVFMFLDTQWWLEDWDNEPNMNQGCSVKTRGEWLKRIKELILEYRHEQLVIFMHHPMHSNGNHGGNFSWKQHLFPLTDVNPYLYIPLPGIGSLYPVLRQGVGRRQDIDHPLYQQLTKGILDAAGSKRGLIFVSSHENSLEYHNLNWQHFIVSGTGSQSGYVRNGNNAPFVSSKLGYSKLDQMSDGSMQLAFYDEDNEQLFEQEIAKPKIHFDDLDTNYVEALPDSFLAPAYAGYTMSKFGQLFMGPAYRDVWTTPVTLPVLDVTQYAGGLTPILKGGGYASNSLRLKDKNGKQYAMRSVNKDLANVLPVNMQKLKAANILRDQTVANYTYGGLPLVSLSNALGIYHTNAKLYYVPKQAGLGEFNQSFGDELYWMEERPTKDGSDAPHFGNSKKIVGYNDLILNLEAKQHHTVDQKATLRARLFDLWVHDWDRHDDQWRWASFKEDGKTIYRPIPRDRDQAFYHMNGLIPWITYTFVERKFVPFKKRFIALKGQPFNARYFDRYYLTDLEKTEWEDVIDEFVNDITDGLIDSAMQSLPKEIRNINAAEFAEKLKVRKGRLEKFALRHYKLISKFVNVVGTDLEDEFEVIINDDRSLTVNRYYEGKKKKRTLAYSRTFHGNETKVVTIYALEGKDRIEIKGEKRPKVRLRIIGGLGKDVVRNDSKKTGWLQVYDDSQGMRVNSEKPIVAQYLNDQVGNNSYNRTDFQYDRFSLPSISVGYTADDGVWIGSGFVAKTHRFRKLPYASMHKFSLRVAPGGREAFEVNYEFDYTKILFRTIGLGANVDFEQPVYRSFFGFGNDSKIVSNDDRFNWVRMHRSNVHPFFKYQTNTGKHSVRMGPSISLNRVIHFDGRVTEIDTLTFSSNDFEFRTYAGAHAEYEFNTVDNMSNPTRGAIFTLSPFWNQELTNSKMNFGLQTSLSFYLTFGDKWRPTLATRVGFDYVGGSPEIYYYPTLGVNTYLRGYRNDRFTGDKVFYTNVEWRLPIVNWKNRILPMKIGVGLAADLGRVWFPGQTSQKWHAGYTGSVSINILDFLMVVPSGSYSEDGFYFNFGTGWTF
ncbi:MAG: hypothetical protein ACI9UJ_001960 [bacterium]|jgi:hypothetical protein